MLTYKLWRLLNAPPTHHRLFWHASQQLRRHTREEIPTYNTRFSSLERFSVFYLALLITLLVITNLVDIPMQSFFLIMLLFLLPLPLLIPFLATLTGTIFSGTYNGLIWCAQISRLIGEERARNTYDLLGTTPGGAFGALWALASGCLYFGYRFNRAQEIHNFLMRMIVVVGVVFLLDAFLGRGRSPLFDASNVIGHFALVVIFVHVDFIQSIVLSLLVGMLIPLFSRDRVEIRLWAVGGLLSLQLAIYAAALIVILNFPHDLNEPIPATFIALSIYTVLVLSLRESCIGLVWRTLHWRTNTRLTEGRQHIPT